MILRSNLFMYVLHVHVTVYAISSHYKSKVNLIELGNNFMSIFVNLL